MICTAHLLYLLSTDIWCLPLPLLASWVSKISSENEEMEKAAVCDRCFIRLSPFVVENIFGKVFVVCWASAPSVRPWRQVDCGGRGSPPHTWTALCSVCILHCVNGALFWQYFENMISPLSALAVITDRQACLSHCNLDSWIGGRQCYLIIDSVWPIFISRDFWNFGPFFEPNR